MKFLKNFSNLFKRKRPSLICYHIIDATNPPYDYFADGRRGWFKPKPIIKRHPLEEKYCKEH